MNFDISVGILKIIRENPGYARVLALIDKKC